MLGKAKHVSNHQPCIYIYIIYRYIWDIYIYIISNHIICQSRNFTGERLGLAFWTLTVSPKQWLVAAESSGRCAAVATRARNGGHRMRAALQVILKYSMSKPVGPVGSTNMEANMALKMFRVSFIWLWDWLHTIILNSWSPVAMDSRCSVTACQNFEDQMCFLGIGGVNFYGEINWNTTLDSGVFSLATFALVTWHHEWVPQSRQGTKADSLLPRFIDTTHVKQGHKIIFQQLAHNKQLHLSSRERHS